jgi:4'-phosphopantetheinyl transferase
VQVWRVSLVGRASEAEGLATLLDGAERARAERFLRPVDRDAYVLSHGWLRTILGAVVGRAPGQLRFATNGCGKPRLAGAEAVSFNLSHTEGLALIALTLGRQVGIDVERMRAERPLAALTERLFPPGEAEAWAQLAPGRQCAAFYEAWTRKEALLKAQGTGLAGPLDKGCGAAEAEGWSVAGLAPGAGYAAAVAVEGDLGSLRCWET